MELKKSCKMKKNKSEKSDENAIRIGNPRKDS